MSCSLLLDENLSARLISRLDDIFPGSLHVRNYGLTSESDREVWSLALNMGLVIMTKDNDFVHLSHLNGCPPKVIKLNCGNRSTEYIAMMVVDRANQIKTFATSDACYMELI